jgi:hypothetical protein
MRVPSRQGRHGPAFGYEIMKRFATVMLDRLDASRLRLIDIYG